MGKYKAIILLVFLLIFPLPVAAQAPEPYTDPCDQVPLRAWQNSRDLQAKNGICILNNTSLSPDQPMMDFILRFKLGLEPGAQLAFSYGTSMNDEYQLIITPTEVSLVNYIRFGNASSTVHEKLLANVPLQITTGKWIEIEFGMQAHRQWLTVDGETVIDRNTARYRGVGIRGSQGVYLDDIQLEQVDLSVNGAQLPSYPPDLSQTRIIFLNDTYELAMIHPDGTGMQVLAHPIAESFPVQALFSPDGKTLLINQEDGEKSLLNFYSIEKMQFIGSEISLPRSPKFDWMPDGRHVLVFRGLTTENLIFEKIDILTGQVVATYPIPAEIDQQNTNIRSVTMLDCSPTAESVLIEVYLDVVNENVQRVILFDLASQQAHFLPGSETSLWSPDGTTLFSKAGGLIDPQNLAFSEFPRDIVRKITNYHDYAWSPNGQFIHIGTENAGNEEYMVYIADLEAQKVMTLPLIGFGSFAPDSLHFVFSDEGRLIIRSLFDATELQIAEGSFPTWQPAPGMYQAKPVLPQQPTAELVQAENIQIETSQTNNLDAPTSGQSQDTSSSTSNSPEKSDQKTEMPAWPYILFTLSALGLASSGGFAYLRHFRRCPSCKRANPGSDPFCMYCGAQLGTPARVGPTLVLLALLAGSLCLAVGGAAGLLLRPKQNLTAPILNTARPQSAQLDTPQTKPSTSQAPSSLDFPCGTLDLAKSDLLTAIKQSESGQTNLTQFFSQFSNTPITDPTAVVVQAETQVARFEELARNTCTVSFLSISPDGQYILVSGSNASVEGGQGFWTALYNRHTYQPIWVQPAKIETQSFDDFAWSPAGDTYAVSSRNISDEEAITVYEIKTGSAVSNIPASTRKGAYCTPMNVDGGQFRWTADGEKLIRKIDNAVQVLDAATGAVSNEIAFDDSTMGSPYAPPDDNRCFFVLSWASDGSRFATLGASIEVSDHPTYNGLKIWDAASSEIIAEKEPGVRYPSSLSFSPDGRTILVTGSSPMIIDTQTGQVLLELKACPVCEGPSSVIWTPDSQRVLLYEGNNLGLFDLTTQSWQTMTLSTYQGAPQEWLDDQGNVLMTGNGLPTVVNVLRGEEISLSGYFK